VARGDPHTWPKLVLALIWVTVVLVGIVFVALLLSIEPQYGRCVTC